jgi:hypothetical protein
MSFPSSSLLPLGLHFSGTTYHPLVVEYQSTTPPYLWLKDTHWKEDEIPLAIARVHELRYGRPESFQVRLIRKRAELLTV